MFHSGTGSKIYQHSPDNSWRVSTLEQHLQSRVPRDLLQKIYELHMPKDGMVYNVYGDGNCLFRAVSVSLLGNEEGYQELRQLTAKELPHIIEQEMRGQHLPGERPTPASIQAYWLNYYIALRRVDGRTPKGGETIQHYANIMARDSVWGGLLEIKTLSSILKRTIHCINYSSHSIESLEVEGSDPLYIFNTGGHFHGFWVPLKIAN